MKNLEWLRALFLYHQKLQRYKMADDIYATIETNQQLTVDTIGIQGLSATTGSLGDISDVNTTLLENGSVLVYKTATSKWTSTRLLNQQDMDSGEF